MRIFSPGLKSWKQFWKGDLRAGISVAFIAIPLNLGIGLASGVPPLAAVIPCVVGGLLAVWISGGYLNVHSTPKMLIGVTAASVISLGNGDLMAGYKMFLMAVVLAGVVQLMLGLMRMGLIGELIPATVVKGIIASVGLIIIFKQFNVLLGVESDVSSTIDHAKHIGSYLLNTNPAIALVGIVSLVIMFIHPRIELPVLRAIPAAVWVILVSVGYSYAIGIASGQPLQIFGFEFNLGPEHLLSLPDDISQSLTLPNLQSIGSKEVWALVPIIVLISSIEGILSSKAIDRLDPLKRRSNLNKELAATGFSTSISGMIGGLPVIPALVGTSVGVNHNGRSSFMNTVHGLMIVILIVALGSVLQHIPLAALAGILIHTGYKLANPEEFVKVYKIGPEQLSIFLLTLGITLSYDLMLGILAGTLLTLFFHVVHLRSVVKLFSALFRPNVVLYEEDEDNKFYVGVRGYSNFLNYPRLRKALDVIPRNATINLDLSLAEFIDHTVMELLSEYEENHIRKGGSFEVIGLDNHASAANHPLSTRLKGRGINSAADTLTSRQKKLKQFAEDLGWEFDQNVVHFPKELDSFSFFYARNLDRSYNRLFGHNTNSTVLIEDVDFHTGEYQTKVEYQSTVAIIELENEIPVFTIEKEHVFDQIAALAGYTDINFKKFKNFSKQFLLKGLNEKEIRAFFTDQLLRFLENRLIYRMESSGSKILIIGKERFLSHEEIKELHHFTTDLLSNIHSS